MIFYNILQNKNSKEKSQIKSLEIAKLKHSGVYNGIQHGTKIEIIGEVKAIEINGQHGIELFARAWRGTQQLGFGSDGSVEIERFRIFNPPILVDDPNGTIIRESINPDTQLVVQRKLREDPIEAIRQTIAHNVKIVGKDNGKIISGKSGNTTSTFYPVAGANEPVDGQTRRVADEVWATIRSGAGTGAFPSGQTSMPWGRAAASATTNQWEVIARSFALFNTSSIPDTDNVDSATISGYGITVRDNLGSQFINLVAGTPAANNNLVAADFNLANHGSTKFITNTLISGLSTGVYNNFALNASGLAAINKTGITKFSLRIVSDIDNVEPTWSSGNDAVFDISEADETGTTQDPKLVIEHSVAITFVPKIIMS